MVERAIVLSLVISKKGIERDKANIQLIMNLLTLRNVKNLDNFLVMWAFVDGSSKIFPN